MDIIGNLVITTRLSYNLIIPQSSQKPFICLSLGHLRLRHELFILVIFENLLKQILLLSKYFFELLLGSVGFVFSFGKTLLLYNFLRLQILIYLVDLKDDQLREIIRLFRQQTCFVNVSLAVLFKSFLKLTGRILCYFNKSLQVVNQ